MGSVGRGLFIYCFLLVVFRISGKRSLSETNSFDLVLLLIISETTQQAMVVHDQSITNAVVLIMTLVGADVLLSHVKQWNPVVQRMLDDLPLIVVEDGRMLEDRMKKERIDKQDILIAARRDHGLESLENVRYAVLEPDGRISIIPRR